MKPIIGVTPLFDDEKESIWMLPAYLNAITGAGGIPIIFPLHGSDEDILQICDMCNGFLFTGGQDVDPNIYGEEIRPLCGGISHSRDREERIIWNYTLKEDKPLLGICRGIQIINALEGGTLYQDIMSEKLGSHNHSMTKPYDRILHYVSITPNSPLSILYGVEHMGVNSFHHQGVHTLAPTLECMATSDDGIIEAVYMKGKRFVQAVQWHPEFLIESCDKARLLFSSFIAACKLISNKT